MIPVLFQITLEQPLLTTSLNGDPNSSVAFDYIPGSVIRGMLIGRETHSIDLNHEDIRRLYFGETHYLNAYPLVDGVRLSPVPASWRVEKGTSKPKFYDVAIDDPSNQKQVVRIKKPFQYAKGNVATTFELTRHLKVHIDRGNRKRGRANRDEGAVYRYDALADGQTFGGVILCQTEDDAAYIRDQIPSYTSLGGAQSGGYGRVSIQMSEFHWDYIGEVQASETLQLTALSDWIIRDTFGNYTTSAKDITAWINRTLGRNDIECKSSFDNITEIGGFNRKWGLPLPQIQAIAMGSVFVFEGGFSVDELDLLRQVSQNGIGERTLDGFGQVAVNMLPVEHVQPHEEQTGQAMDNTVNLTTDEDRANALMMLERMAQRDLEQKIHERANQIRFKNIPNPAQLAQLRRVIQEHLMAEDPNISRVKAFMDSLNERQDARRQFERFKVDNKRFWLWWETLESNPKLEGDYNLGDVTVEMQQYEPIYVLRLLDEVLDRAIREQQKAN